MKKTDSEKKITIAFVNVMDGYSGGEVVLKRLIEGLDPKLFEPVVYTKKTKFVKMLKCDRCTVVLMPQQYQLRQRRDMYAFFNAMKNFFVSGRYVWDMKYNKKVDIIHSNSLTSSIYFALWAKVFRIKFVAHNHLIRSGKLYSILYKYITICSDKVICVSEAVKKCWIDAGVPKEKLTVVYNGLPDDFF